MFIEIKQIANLLKQRVSNFSGACEEELITRNSAVERPVCEVFEKFVFERDSPLREVQSMYIGPEWLRSTISPDSKKSHI